MHILLKIFWNVNPQIITEPLELRWYSLLFALSFILGYYLLKRIFKNDGVPLVWVDDALMYVMFGTILGARLGHCLFYDFAYFSQHPMEILLPFRFEPEFKFIGFQGLASHGAAIGIIASLWLFSKRVSKKSLLWILDRVMLAIALAAFLIRFGNLMNHEIVGKPTDLPWGFVFSELGDGIPRHPSQLYEAISYLLIWGLLMLSFWKKKRYQYEGFIFGLFLIMMFSTRFIMEFFKENQSDFENGMIINMGQVLSMPFALAGVYFLYKSRKNTPKMG